MASTNQSPFYTRAEAEFNEAKTDDERIACLDIMIKECPKHKSSEKMLKNLTLRQKKLKKGLEKRKKSGRGGKVGIKKAEMQCVLFGLPSTGKSTIFNKLTKEKPFSRVSPHPFTTYSPVLGTFDYEDVKVQIIDDAPSPNHSKSLVNVTDVLLIVINSLDEIKKADKDIWRSKAHKIYLFNKSEKLTQSEKRKIEANLKSKYKGLDYFFLSSETEKREITELKKKIFEKFPIIRIYTKEPGKKPSSDPMILKRKSKVKVVAEKILKGMSKKIKQIRIWGPSSKFGGQSVGIEHILKDKDIIEFRTT